MIQVFKKQAWILGGFEYLHADTPFETDPGSGGARFVADADGAGDLYPYAKMAYGASGTQTPVSTANPMPVQLRNSSGTEIGTAGNPVRTNPTGGTAQPITDNSGSVTTDTPQLPASLGQANAAGSVSVVLASDGALPLPAGAATAARQDTGNTALAAIQTAVETLDNAIAGSEMQVDVVAALPAGSNTIGGVNLAQYTPASGRLPVDGSGVTQPISAAALPLPSGAATEAKQPALGTAGSPSADVITIQGRASMTPVQIADGGGSVTTDFSGQSTPGSAVPAAGVAMTGSDGTNARHLRTDANGELQIDVLTVPADPFGANADAASATGSISAKLRQIAANGIPVTSLPASTNTIEVVGDVAHDAAAAGNPVLVGGYASDTAPSDVSAAGDVARAWVHLDGSLAVVDKPRASGGLSIHRLLSTASGNATNVKNAAGQIYGAIITNTNAAVRYVKFYNSASAPTAGSGTPVMTLAIPGNSAGAGMVFNFDKGIAFSSGIGYTTVTGAADNDSTGVAANEIIMNLFYR